MEVNILAIKIKFVFVKTVDRRNDDHGCGRLETMYSVKAKIQDKQEMSN